jgi:hypothetical protein
VTGRRSWLVAAGVTVAVSLAVEAGQLSGRGPKGRTRRPTPTGPNGISSGLHPSAPTGTAMPRSAPDSFVLRPGAADAPRTPAAPGTDAAVSTAVRWAGAYTSGDPGWRQFVSPDLTAQLAEESPALDAAVVQWSAPAAVDANTARVYVYVTATAGGVEVALSYDCELVRFASGWRLVGVLR